MNKIESIRPMAYNQAASFDYGWDCAEHWCEQGFVEDYSFFLFHLEVTTANMGHDRYMEAHA